MVLGQPSYASERRDVSGTAPWCVVVDRQTGNVFFATHQGSGRTYRLPAASHEEAETMVALLNGTSLEMRV